MNYRHAHGLIIGLTVVTILLCIGGLFTGWVAQENDELRRNSKIESEIVDVILDEGEAEVIITLKEDLEIPDLEVEYRYENINAISGKLDRSVLRDLAEDPNVESIHLNKIYKISLSDSASLINATSVWESKLNGVYLRGDHESVCVIDTGVNYNHAALGGCFGSGCKVLGGHDFVNNDTDPMDDESHGTHVAGIVSSEDSTYQGIAPNSNIVAMKVCDSGGNCAQDDILAGIDRCVSNASVYNISVIVLSLGDDGSYNASNCPTDFDSSVNSAVANGIFVVASSGNNYHNGGISSPACSPNITSVGATDKSDNIWDRSNSGDLLDLLAPGVSITSSILSGFGSKSGTSMAAPHVAGAVILINQHNRLRSASQSVSEIKQKLIDTGTNITDGGSGIATPKINLKEAILMAKLRVGNNANPYPKTDYNFEIYANYTNRTSHSAISGGNCTLDINGTSQQMNYNGTSYLYEDTRNFTIADTYEYNITCNNSNFETLIKSSSVEVVQGSENCTYPGSNIDWNLTGNDFSRCVGENIILNQSNLNIQDNAEFILTDTNLTLVGASVHYSINITGDSNVTLNNVLVKGLDQTTRRLDLEIYGHANIYNSSFENSGVLVRGNKSHIIDNSTFTYLVYFEENSTNTITSSNFTSYVYFDDFSDSHFENSALENRIYSYENSVIKFSDSNLSGLIRILDNSVLNFSGSNITNEIRFYNSPIMYGEVDMPDSVVMSSNNLTRYFPVYVYYTGTSNPYPNKQVNLTNSEGNLIWQGTTNSNGYVEIPITFNTTNYLSGNFTLSTNSSQDTYLLTDTPITLEATAPATVDDTGNGGGGGGSGGDEEVVESCTENWICGGWNECVDGLQNKTCIDANDCGTNVTKPSYIQSCDIPDDGGGGSFSIQDENTSEDIDASPELISGRDPNQCCVLGVCWFRYFLCWVWWGFIVLAIILSLIIKWFIEHKRKRKKLQKALLNAFGMDWAKRHLHLQ